MLDGFKSFSGLDALELDGSEGQVVSSEVTPPKFNIDTKNDGFFLNVPPFKYGYFGYPCWFPVGFDLVFQSWEETAWKLHLVQVLLKGKPDFRGTTAESTSSQRGVPIW